MYDVQKKKRERERELCYCLKRCKHTVKSCQVAKKTKNNSTQTNISVSTKTQTSDFICHLSWLCMSFPMCATVGTKTTADTITPLYTKCAGTPWKDK